MPKSVTRDDFIARAKDVHGGEYDYSKLVYAGMHTKVLIICRKHGEFQQNPQAHLRGQLCIMALI